MTSVCMATYNGARFIREQIDSILPQLGAEDELIISDDGSTDGTLGILAEYATADARVKVLHHEKCGNRYYPSLKLCFSTSNFENALRHANGDHIFLSDQDDVWEKDKVKKSLEFLRTHDFVIHNLSLIDDFGTVIKEQYYSKTHLKFRVPADLLTLSFWGCCACFRRKILEKALPFPPKIAQHDSWIGLVAEKYGSCFWNDECLIRYRIFSRNTSTGGRKSENSFWLKIKYRLNMLVALTKR